MPNLLEETRQKFIPQPKSGTELLTAKVGDRMIMMSMTGDEDVLEVILARKKTVIARALTSETVEKGAKYTIPAHFNGYWPVMVGMTQVSLFRAPQHATEAAPKEKRVKPAPGESKIAKCKAIYASHPFSGDLKADKAAIVKRFIEEVNCTPAGANTYYITCAKS